MRVNRFKNALKQGRTVFGMAVYSYSPTLVEVIGHSGFDFVFLDMILILWDVSYSFHGHLDTLQHFIPSVLTRKGCINAANRKKQS